METRLLIRGEQVAGEGPALEVENPATEETLTELGTASPEQLDAAIAGAREAAPGWGATPAVERAELLHEVATRMRALTDDLVQQLGALDGRGRSPAGGRLARAGDRRVELLRRRRTKLRQRLLRRWVLDLERGSLARDLLAADQQSRLHWRGP